MFNYPQLDFRDGLKPLNKDNIRYLIQHHTAHPTWDVYETHNYHKNTRGWLGIGYNIFIEKDGTIQWCRGFNRGAHALGYNAISLGICYAGNFMEQEVTEQQIEAGIKVNTHFCKKLTLNYTDIVGHGDLTATLCPGVLFTMAEIKEGVKENLKPQKDWRLEKAFKYIDVLAEEGLLDSPGYWKDKVELQSKTSILAFEISMMFLAAFGRSIERR